MKNALYVENGKLTGNHPLLITNKWLTEVDLNNIDYIDVKDSDLVLTPLFLYLVFTKQLQPNKVMVSDCIYLFNYKLLEFIDYPYDNNNYDETYHLMDDNLNILFFCNKNMYGDKCHSLEFKSYLYNKIINTTLNKDELLIKYLT